MAVKEILHNIVKYSGSTLVKMTARYNRSFILEIEEDNGRGFDLELAKQKGNGLYNMERRIASAGGKIEILREIKAMTEMMIGIVIP